MTAEKYDSNFERTCKFRAGLQDALSVYKNGVIEKYVRLSNQVHCPIQACHNSQSRQRNSTFDIKADSHRRCRYK